MHISRRADTNATAGKSRENARTLQLSPYGRFSAMVFTSTAVMFLLTYTNVFALDHIYWSEERFYMALIMGSAMTVIMLSFMWNMLSDTRVNLGIIAGAAVMFILALWLSRSQHFVDDQAYMQGMIPHHSIAILTSERAGIDDVRVRELADGITATQKQEIAQMKWLLNDIDENGLATTDAAGQERPVPEFRP